MLSVFPEILFLSPLAPLLIRVAAAAVFGYAAWQHIGVADTRSRGIAIVEAACALLLTIGLYTQPAALLGILLFLVHAFVPALRAVPVSTGLLLLVMCVTLLFTGAGAFAFDLPL